MNQLISTVKFVNAGLQNANTTPQTSDLLFVFFGTLFVVVLAILGYLFISKNKRALEKHNIRVEQNFNGSAVTFKKLFGIITTASICLIFMILLVIALCSNAFAQDSKQNLSSNEFCPEVINVYVYEDTGNIKAVDDYYINNKLDHKIKLTSISVEETDQSLDALWKVSDEKQEVYNNKAGHKKAMPNDYLIEAGAFSKFYISCSVDTQHAKEVINKNVAKIKFDAVEMQSISGCIKDMDENCIEGAKASFIADDGQTLDTVYSDVNGNFKFILEKGTSGKVKLEVEHMETRETGHLVLNQDIDLETIYTCFKKKATVPNKADPSSLVYNGDIQDGFTNIDDTVIYVGEISAKNAGTYEVDFRPAQYHCWPNDGKTNARHYTWCLSKKALEVGLVDQSIVYGELFPSKDNWEFTYKGFVKEEGPKDLSGNLALDTKYDHRSSNVNVDGYEVNFNGSSLSSSNYEIKYINGRLYLEQRITRLTWGDATWIYDGNAHGTTCVATDLINTDNVQVDLEGNSITNVAESGKTVRAKGLIGDKALNYFIDPNAKKQISLSISKAEPKLSVEDVKVVRYEDKDCVIDYNGDASSLPKFDVKDTSIATVSQDIGSGIKSFSVRTQKLYGHTSAHVTFAEGNNYKSAECEFLIDVAQVYGWTTSVQNLLDKEGKPKVKYRDGIFVELVINPGENEQIAGQGYSDDHGFYRISVNPIYEDSSFDAYLRVDVPGVNKYLEPITINPKTSNNKNIENLTGLDFYTIDELKQVSDILGSTDKIDVNLRSEFERYIDNDVVWYSNSAGRQPKTVNVKDVSSADPTKCNQDYKNNFVIDESKIVPENIDLDQFLFLRLIDIATDKEAFFDGEETGKTAGITLQTIRSLPRAYPFCGHADVTWWGDENCFLRKDLSYDGEIISHLNENFKNNMLNISKTTQKSFDKKQLDTAKTSDKMFILSYSEMCCKDTVDPDFLDYEYLKNGGEGLQYKWYDNHNIAGYTVENEDLTELCKVNSGEEIAEGNARTFQRTTYFGAGTNFLTTNFRGSIRTYAQSKQRVGIAPAFCFGTPSKVFDINLLGDNVDYINLEDHDIGRHKQVVDDASFSFKIKCKEGKTLESVTVNGTKIEPDNDVYTINNIHEQKTIVSKTKGEQDAPIIEGNVNFEQNIGEDQSVGAKKSSSEIKIVEQSGQVLATVASDTNGKYICALGTSAIGKNAHIAIDAAPGVCAYRSDDFTIASGHNSKDVFLHSLDSYTIDDLKKVSTWLSSHKDQTDSSCYKEFSSYINDDVIWYSNSKGQQPSNVSVEQSKFADTSKCNQNYVCSFIKNSEGNIDTNNVDNFLFLRLIGINNDEKSDSTDTAGLSFQTIHVLPITQTMSSGDAQWWGNSFLRASLSNGGIINSYLNNSIKSAAISVKKYNQKSRQVTPDIQFTDDKFFVTSYSEMWNKNGVLVGDHSWYGNSGNKTEGRVYDWYKVRDINGGDGNEILKPLVFKNSGVAPGEKLTTWERSVCCTGGNNYFLATDVNGSLISSNFNFGETGLALCFAL